MISMLKKASLAALAVAGLSLGASSALAGSVTLGTSGWSASWDSSLDARLGIVFDGESTDSVFVEKFATFTTNEMTNGVPSGLVVTFHKDSTNAKPFLVIDNEAVTNSTNATWNGFQFILAPAGSGVTFDTGKTAGPPAFSINPFTTATYSPDSTVLTVGGGSLGSTSPNNTWFPGTSGALWITTAGASTTLDNFSFKELPIVGPGPGPGPAVPLPAAAWSGLTGLIGLGLVSSRKQLRKLFS